MASTDMTVRVDDEYVRRLAALVKQAKPIFDELADAVRIVSGFEPPMIGDVWPEHGGVYAGVRRILLPNRLEHFYFLVVGPDSNGRLTFNEAGHWMNGLRFLGHSDYVIANRGDGRLFAMNCEPSATLDRFWLEERDQQTAFMQFPDTGDQGYINKIADNYALAVRRVPMPIIQRPPQ